MKNRLNWDPDKRRKKDLEREERDLKVKIGQMWNRFKRETVRRPRSFDDLIIGLDALKLEMANLIRPHSGLLHYLKYTEDLIEAKKNELTALKITNANRIVQYRPPEAVKATPIEAVFTTRAEFERIPFVQLWMTQPGFIGFIRGTTFVHAALGGTGAVHVGGIEFPIVGSVSHHGGLEEYPTMEQFVRACEDMPGNNSQN